MIVRLRQLLDSLFGMSRRRELWGFVVLIVALPAVTALLVLLRDGIHPATGLVVFLLLVVVIASMGGHRPAVLAAVLSPQLANWFLVEPYGSFRIDDRENLVALMVFVAVALIVSWFVAEAARRGAQAAANAAATARAETLARVDELRTAILRSVSHDLRTPLATIKAAVSSLRTTDIDWPEVERAEFLETIEDQTDRLTAVVNDLLDLSRLQAGVLTPQITNTSIDEVLPGALTDHHRGSPLHVDVPDDLPEIAVDPALMRRVVDNLVSNAMRYAPENSPVTVRAASAGGHVTLSVIDHGPGIPEGDRRRVLEPFQRLSDSHTSSRTGLGLAIVDGLLSSMGGALELTETPGGGLTATVIVPTAPAPTTGPATAPATAHATSMSTATATASTPSLAAPSLATPSLATSSLAAPSLAAPSPATPSLAAPSSATAAHETSIATAQR